LRAASRRATGTGHDDEPALAERSRLRVDLAVSGAEIDLTVHALMAGMAVRVPAGRRVW
jgi:hypothetical protein